MVYAQVIHLMLHLSLAVSLRFFTSYRPMTEPDPSAGLWHTALACGGLRVLTCTPASGSEPGCRNDLLLYFQSIVSVFVNFLILFISCHSVPGHGKCFFISHFCFCGPKPHFGISGPMRWTPPLTMLQRPIQILMKYFLCQPII